MSKATVYTMIIGIRRIERGTIAAFAIAPVAAMIALVISFPLRKPKDV